jgi:threonine dehydratase
MPITEQRSMAAECRRASERIAGIIHTTRVLPDPRTGMLLKLETEQVTGSFKARGAFNALSGLNAPDVVVGSSGNHGIAVAWAAQQLDVSASVVMTNTASRYKREMIRRLGARVLINIGGNAARGKRVEQIAENTAAVAVSSYDHPLVIAGQSTVGAELLEQVPDLRAVVAPLGGGGLLAGIALSVQASGRPIEVYGVEPVTANDTAQSLAAGRRISIDPPQSVCDGVLAQSPGEFTFSIIQQLATGVLQVTDEEVVQAMRDLAGLGLRTEPTGALAYAGARRLPRQAGVAVVLSGSNIEPAQYRRLIAAESIDSRS